MSVSVRVEVDGCSECPHCDEEDGYFCKKLGRRVNVNETIDSECPFIGKDEEEEKGCSTCLHEMLAADMYPCSDCDPGSLCGYARKE